MFLETVFNKHICIIHNSLNCFLYFFLPGKLTFTLRFSGQKCDSYRCSGRKGIKSIETKKCRYGNVLTWFDLIPPSLLLRKTVKIGTVAK